VARYLIEDTYECYDHSATAGACPQSYYKDLSFDICRSCNAECLDCFGGSSTCTACQIGYELNGSSCQMKCGNGIREDDEECDDGGSTSFDGCSFDCFVEDGFFCSPDDPDTLGPDVCRCDHQIIHAKWEDYWGGISIKFGSTIVYDDTVAPRDSDARGFCA